MALVDREWHEERCAFWADEPCDCRSPHRIKEQTVPERLACPAPGCLRKARHEGPCRFEEVARGMD